MKSIGRDEHGQPCLPNDDILFSQMTAIAGRLGAKISAAVKRAKRQLIFSELYSQKEEGVDLTYHAVQNLAERLIGRKFDSKVVLSDFATPGRTAAQKTLTNRDELKIVEDKLKNELDSLISEIESLKIKARIRWEKSKKRKAILEDWKMQRINQKVESIRFSKFLANTYMS